MNTQLILRSIIFSWILFVLQKQIQTHAIDNAALQKFYISPQITRYYITKYFKLHSITYKYLQQVKQTS